MLRYFVVAFFVMLIDQITKWLVVKKMYLGQSIPLIEGFFYLTSHRNAGAAFGILQGQRLFFILITIIVIIGLVYFLAKGNQKPLVSWALALILGGAIGNFIDRVSTGEVVDFFDVKINLGFFYYDYPIFNVADSALVVGVLIILVDTLIDSLKERKTKKLDAEERER